MGGIFGVTSKSSCTLDLFFGTDYHSHLGTRRGGMAVYGSQGFHRSIHNIENTPFRTKFDGDLDELEGTSGIGCISDNEPQPLMVQSHLGTFAITTVGKINNMDELVDISYKNGCTHFLEMSGGAHQSYGNGGISYQPAGNDCRRYPLCTGTDSGFYDPDASHTGWHLCS